MDLVDTVREDFFVPLFAKEKCLQMNYTRLLWSEIYACRRHDPDYMAVIGISVFIPTLVLVFYVSAVFKGKEKKNRTFSKESFFGFSSGERKEKKLSRRKLNLVVHVRDQLVFSSVPFAEKRLPHRIAANARVDTQTWLWSNPTE